MTSFRYHTFVNLTIVCVAILLLLERAHFIPHGLTKTFFSLNKVAQSEFLRRMIRLILQVQSESVKKLCKSASANIKIFHNFRYLKKGLNALWSSFKTQEKYLMSLRALMIHLSSLLRILFSFMTCQDSLSIQ